MAVLIVTLLLSFLMVSTIKYRSFKDLKFRGRQHITYLVWGILALVLVAAWPEVMLFVMFAGYALLGPIVSSGCWPSWRENQRESSRSANQNFSGNDEE